MERILLVEPDYNNKYPPIGLMKIATYHKGKGDYVEFYKGKAPFQLISKMDRVYITSIFTFFFDITVETILHYLNYIDKNKVYIGGIAVTLMQEEFKRKTKVQNILTGQLVDSCMLGYSDHVNIDMLPLDYDILDDIEYDYGVMDNFFAHTTRGCPRKCDFCAVKILEPNFEETNNLVDQITYVRNIFGDRRNLMLMDNNIFFSNNLEEICSDLLALGFVKNKPTYIPENPAILFYKKIERRQKHGYSTWIIVDQFILFFEKFINRIKKVDTKHEVETILNEIKQTNNHLQVLLDYQEKIVEVVEKYRNKKPLQRYIDFNQGLDARLITDEKMRILSQLPLRPFRLAYDNIGMTKTYIKAFRMAYKWGIRHFSNYMLYNFEDTPDDLWQRAYTNIKLYNKYNDIEAFSFPMKYAPIDMIDRSYVGVYWNKKYLSAMNIILNVTKGIIAKEKDFFLRAYGNNSEEFREILSMPNEFIKFRDFFEKNGLIQAWIVRFRNLDITERESLLEKLSGNENGFDNDILKYYKITKRQVETKTINLEDYI